MANLMRLLFLILPLLLLVSACEKNPGEGGTSSIEGKIMIEEVDNFGVVVKSYPALEERVYIIYGDNEFFDNEVRTHFNGRYQFEFLNIGSYQIYAYSECFVDSCTVPKYAEIIEVGVSANNQVVNSPDITILKQN